MASYELGKTEVCEWARNKFPANSTVLDVGACDGKWRRLLPEYTMDACEIFPPNAYRLSAYRNVYIEDILNLKYVWYDLIIFGDVIEHMSTEDAQAVLEYAKPRCTDMIVSVPYHYAQDELYGNKYEIHLQPDLDELTFYRRYGAYSTIWSDGKYCYYHKYEKHRQ